MNERMIALERTIENDLEEIEAIFRDLEGRTLSAGSSEETAIVVGYRLHNLYSGFENIFRAVAAVFENHIDDRERWHRLLLDRMRLDLSPVRPAVIDDTVYEQLEELLRFRHLFRAAYGTRLDPGRLALVHDKAMELRATYRGPMNRFLDFLRRLGEDDD